MPALGARSVNFLLDSSAILAYLLDEPEAVRVSTLRHQAGLPFVALSELYAALWMRFGQAQADEAVASLRQWHLPWLWPNEQVMLLAGRWRALHRLGLADSLIAALCFLAGATLVTKDQDFRVLQPDLKLLFLR